MLDQQRNQKVCHPDLSGQPAGRMDPYVDLFQEHGGSMVVSKRKQITQVMMRVRNMEVSTLDLVGGPAAIAKQNIKSVEVVDFPD